MFLYTSLSFMVLLLTVVSASPKERRQAPAGSVECVCVAYYLCNENNAINTNGEGLLDVRVKTQGTTPPPEIQAKGNPCGTWEVCCSAPENEPVTPTTPAPYVPQCGKRHIEGLNTRILNPFLGQDEAKMGEFPWQAAILRIEGKVNIFICGGTLIDKRFVLTATHCVAGLKPEAVKVRLGEYDTQSVGEPYPFAEFNVKEIVTHPGFYAKALYNDIALLYLEQDVPFAPNIDTACLPDFKQKFHGQTCAVTGWGKNAFEPNGEYQNLLKEVDVPVVPNDVCQALLRKTRLGKFFQLHESFMCAGGEAGKDACKGDGGGPLVCEFNGQYRIAGVVAWGIGCGVKDVPGVYVDVGEFRPWIDEEMAKRTLV